MKYPTFSKEIKFALEPAVHVDATVDMEGRCIVTIHDYAGRFDDASLHPHEAEKFGKALIAAAECARAKRKHKS